MYSIVINSNLIKTNYLYVFVTYIGLYGNNGLN